VFVQAMKMVGIGLALGLAGSVALGRAMVSILYGLSGTDPLSILAASLTLVIVAAIATYLPARRASRVDPAVAMRGA
jgi:putative ABC transport system permease protein